MAKSEPREFRTHEDPLIPCLKATEEVLKAFALVRNVPGRLETIGVMAPGLPEALERLSELWGDCS